MSKEFDQQLKQLVEHTFKRHPNCVPLKKMRMTVKSLSRKSPGLMFNRFRDALKTEGVLDAINRRDHSYFAKRDATISPVPGLFGTYEMLSKEEMVQLWARLDLLVETTTTDDALVTTADESGWSELVSEVLSQHVTLPACLREKATGLLSLVVQFLENQTQEELTSDLDSLLDGVDLSAMMPAEHRETSIDGSLLKSVLPHLKSLQTETEQHALDVTRSFLRSETFKPVVKVLRRACRCVDSGMLVRLLSNAVEKLDVTSLSGLISSVHALQTDPSLARGVAMLSRTANVPALQALVQDAAQLVDPSVLQKITGGTGSGNMLSSLLSSSATPDILSRLPSLVSPDGSIDMTAVPGLMRGQRRKPRKPRLSASRLAH
jgi:hypothetical protein